MVLHIHDLGLSAIAAIRERCESFLKIGEEEGFLWLDELLAECKREFSKPGIALLPKTPSAKRSRRKKREVSGVDDVFQPMQPAPKRSRSKAENELAEIIYRPADKTRKTRASSRTESAPSHTRSTRQTRNTRFQKPEVAEPKPDVSIIKNLEKEMRLAPSPPANNNTPVNHKTTKIRSSLNQSLATKSPARSPRNFSVKNRVNAYEDLIKSVSPKSSPNGRLMGSPALESENTCALPPNDRTLLTMQNSASATNNESMSMETPKTARRSSRASMRKSLKLLPSKSRLSGYNSNYKVIVTENFDSVSQAVDMSQIDTKPVVECVDSPVIQQTEEKVKKARTRLRLKKKEALNEEIESTQEPSESTGQKVRTDSRVSDSAPEQDHSCPSSGTESNSDRAGSSVSDHSEQPAGSTRTKARKLQQSEDDERGHKLQNHLVESANETDKPSDSLKQVKPSRTKSRKKEVDNSHLASTDYESSSETDRPVRSTRTKMRKNKEQNARTSTESEADEDRKRNRPARTKTRKNSAMSVRKSQESTESEEDKQTRTRTKSRKPVSSRSSRSSRSSVKSNSAKCISRSDSEDDSKMIIDSGIHSVKSSVASADNLDASSKTSTARYNDPNGSFAVPTSPAPRTRTKSRKRQIDDEDGMSRAKRSCSEELQHDIMDSHNQTYGSHYSSISDKDEMDVEMSTDDEAFSSVKTPSPLCPRDKVVKPHAASFLNSLNKNKMTPLSGRTTPLSGRMTPGGTRFTPLGMPGGLVKSFLKRDTPTKKLTAKELQERRRNELEEKQKKEKERLHRRDALLKMRIEEQRKKREERMKRVQESKELHLKRDQAQKSIIAKKLEEKQQLGSIMKEEKIKEEKEKLKQRTKKMQEVEDRRKQEEEERQKKLQEQDEEMRRYQEMLQRKKDFEEQERQKKVIEEKRKQEERQQEKERERQEREKQLYLEEEKRRIEIQKQKEEKDRIWAHEKAERERLEQEKRIQRQQAIKIEMEKLKEMEKLRLQKAEDYEKKTEEMRKNLSQMNTLFHMQHNSFLNSSNNKPALNSTVTLNTSADHQPYNPDSYEMTPKKKHKPSSCENYDISQIQSDDSTDDEDAPRKRLPTWAVGAHLKASLITQHYHPPNLDELFGFIDPPDLNEFFVKKKPRFNKRTSSAQWDSPMMKPRTVCY